MSDPYEREAAKAAIHTLQRDLERSKRESDDWRGLVEELADKLGLPSGATRRYIGSMVSNKIDQMLRTDLELALARQDLTTVRRICEKGGSAADVLSFLNTQSA